MVESKQQISLSSLVEKLGFDWRDYNTQIRILCPFHDSINKTNFNFTIFKDTNLFYCHTCGRKGNINTFISVWNGLNLKPIIDLTFLLNLEIIGTKSMSKMFDREMVKKESYDKLLIYPITKDDVIDKYLTTRGFDFKVVNSKYKSFQLVKILSRQYPPIFDLMVDMKSNTGQIRYVETNTINFGKYHFTKGFDYPIPFLEDYFVNNVKDVQLVLFEGFFDSLAFNLWLATNYSNVNILGIPLFGVHFTKRHFSYLKPYLDRINKFVIFLDFDETGEKKGIELKKTLSNYFEPSIIEMNLVTNFEYLNKLKEKIKKTLVKDFNEFFIL